MRLLMAMGAALALAGCNSKRTAPEVEKAWVRLPAVAGRPAAAYFTFEAGGLPQAITRVSAVGAGKAEMHETMTSQGAGAMSMMAPLAKLEVPAGGSVVFAPGGRHVMLFDLDPAIRPGGTMTLDVGDASGQAKVVGAGDPAPY